MCVSFIFRGPVSEKPDEGLFFVDKETKEAKEPKSDGRVQEFVLFII